MMDDERMGIQAWLHDDPKRYDVIHDAAKRLWIDAGLPKQVEHYTIPLYLHEHRRPLSTEEACALLKYSLGIDPMLDGNMLKMLRAVERAHGIEGAPWPKFTQKGNYE